ncbi:MAG: hypothetical protein Q9222_007738 [Ikaeria aurantiellina]
MPVTIKPAKHGARGIESPYHSPLEPEALLKWACRQESRACKELLQSSFSPKPQTITIPSANGFVHGAIRAYNVHHHLRIRPEDVWFAILSQFSLYINAHAEELRGKFVAHEGKEELTLEYSANRYTMDFGLFAKQMGELVEKNVVDAELRRWIMPAFTTTTKNDSIVASILLMGVTQNYFDYKCVLMCGLPSVTLLGNKADWELILSRIEKLKEYGEEPTHFYRLLKPVLSRFVMSFEKPTSSKVVDFWKRICHYTGGGSGPSYYSGWITAFCCWDSDGKLMYQRAKPDMKLDGMAYHRIESGDVPPGYTSVPVKVDDNGCEFMATMIAGSVGMKCVKTQESDPLPDTIQPESGWWMFENRPEGEKAGDEMQWLA